MEIKSFKTFHSGVISTLIKIFIVTYAIFLCSRLFQNKDSIKTVNTIVNDITNDQTKHYIGKNTFGLAIQFKGNSPELLKDPRYFDVYFLQDTYTQNGNNFTVEEYEYIEVGDWKDIFPISDEEYNSYGLDNAICVTGTDYYLQGNSNSYKWNEISISIHQCYNSSESSVECKSEEEINNAMGNNLFHVYTLNSYFDFDDLENPVKTYIHSIDAAPLTPYISQNLAVNVNQNKAILNDGWFFSSNTEEIEFYTNQYSSSFATSLTQFEGYLFLAQFRLDGKMSIYERTSFNFIELFGMLGGIYEIIELTFSLLLSSLSQKMFYNSLLSKLYLIKTSKMVKVATQSTKIVPVQNNLARSPAFMVEENK